MAELASDGSKSNEASISDAFGWACRDPKWINKLVLMGLIGLIPIVGPLQQAGWMLAALDNLRAGHREVPAPAFRYASRGGSLFLAGLIYGGVIFVVVYGGILFIAFGLAPTTSSQTGQSDGSSSQVSLLFFPAMLGWMGVVGLISVAAFLLVPLIIEFTERSGFGGAFNFPGFIRAARGNPTETLAAGGLALVCYFISGVGAYLCYVGVLFTVPYSLTVLAGVLFWYETKVRLGGLPARRSPPPS